MTALRELADQAPGPAAALAVYEQAMTCVPLVAWHGLGRRDRERHLTHIGPLTQEAAAAPWTPTVRNGPSNSWSTAEPSCGASPSTPIPTWTRYAGRRPNSPSGWTRCAPVCLPWTPDRTT